MNDLILGRLVVLSLTVVVWGVFFVFYKVLTHFRKDSLQRVIYGGVCLASALAIVFLQLDAYSALTHIDKPIDNDSFFFLLGPMEYGIPLFVGYFYLWRQYRNRM